MGHQPAERHLVASKVDLETMINHLKMMLSHGNVDLPALLHHGKSVTIVDSTPVTLLPLEDLLLPGPEIVVRVMLVVAVVITTEEPATMLLLLVEMQLRGLNKLLLTPLLLLHMLATLLLATLAVTHLNNLWERLLALPHRLD